MTTATQAGADSHPDPVRPEGLHPTLPGERTDKSGPSEPALAPVHTQVPMFLVVGGVTFLADGGLMRGSIALGVEPKLAITMGFILGLFVHFSLNRLFTFKSRGGSTSRQVTFYAINVAISYLLQVGIIYYGQKWTGIDWAFWKCLAVGVTMVITFFWLRLLVFAPETPPEEAVHPELRMD